MRIGMIGDFSNNLDEGYKNVSHYLAEEIEKHVDFVRLDVKKIRGRAFWMELARFRPHILHVITQPTIASLILTAMVRSMLRGAKTVVSALKADCFLGPGRDLVKEAIVRLTRPDLLLVQANNEAARFANLGCHVKILQNGVDVDRFRPPVGKEKARLRAKYELDPRLPVVLHVGHLESARNLDKLAGLIKNRVQVVIAGSLYLGTNPELIRDLEILGFRLYKGYFPCVEELYRLADCYAFPLEPGRSLSMPLSILEAMATNLVVVSTRFTGIAGTFPEGGGLKYVDDPNEICREIVDQLATPGRPVTRELVRPFSWQSIAGRLLEYYRDCATPL